MLHLQSYDVLMNRMLGNSDDRLMFQVVSAWRVWLHFDAALRRWMMGFEQNPCWALEHRQSERKYLVTLGRIYVFVG